MWPAMLETAVATVFCAAAVKLLDDILDKELDAACGRANWAAKIGPGTVVYAAACLAVAAALNAAVSLALFFASYSVGMFKDPCQRQPSALRGWQESAAAVAIGSVLLGWQLMLFSLSYILAVQLIDDCIDYQSDRRCGQRNLAGRFGAVECGVAGLILLLTACLLDKNVFWPVFAATVIFYGYSMYRQGAGKNDG